jgi:ABC-type transport system substrate-binding protein
MRLTVPQVGGTAVVQLVTAIALVLAGAACDSPARVKPWRHAPDPAAEAAAAPRSAALDAPTDADTRAAREHTMRIQVDAEPGRLTPLVSPSVWARRITLGTIFEPLLRYLPPDEANPAGSYGPRLAQQWKVMPGGMEVRITLQPDVTFSDGVALTSSDVQFTLDAIRDPKNRIDQLRPLLDDVDAIELITSREVRLRMKRPSAWALRALAEIPILPMHVYDGSLTGGGQLVGSGPWKLASNKGGVVHLTRYDKYWGGPAAIADLEFIYQPDAQEAIIEAKRGALDLIPALIPAYIPEQINAPAIAAGFVPFDLAPPRMHVLVWNAARPPLDDANVRHALALLLDRRAIAKDAYHGLARPALWPIWPGGLASGPEAPVPEFDPAGAGKLLDAAGWSDHNKDNVRDRDGKPLHIVLVGLEHPTKPDAANPRIHATARDAFIDAARRAGVIVDVKTGTESWLVKRVADGQFDAVEEVWAGMVDEDVTALVAGPPASRVVTVAPAGAEADAKAPVRASSPRVERALDALGAAWDPAERARLAPELAAALGETWPVAGIVADTPHGLIARRIVGARAWDGWLDLSVLRFAK